MDATVIELRVLTECLKKKEAALQRIAGITDNQGDLLASNLPHNELYALFMQINTEKKEDIQTVLQCDQVFENVFKKVGPVLDDNPTLYGEQVKELQQLIHRVTDLDVRIRVSENNNNRLLTEALERIQSTGQVGEPAPEEPAPLPLPALKPAAPKHPPIHSGEYGNRQVFNAYKKNVRRPKK